MKKEVIEGNKLIAEFMGFNLHHGNLHKTTHYELQKTSNMGESTWSDLFAISEMQFHSSWDWLMPVVARCYEHGDLGREERTAIEESLMGIVDIESTWMACVEFINWYNNKKS
jgi:uncharacterized protein with NRDE domain